MPFLDHRKMLIIRVYTITKQESPYDFEEKKSLLYFKICF